MKCSNLVLQDLPSPPSMQFNHCKPASTGAGHRPTRQNMAKLLSIDFSTRFAQHLLVFPYSRQVLIDSIVSLRLRRQAATRDTIYRESYWAITQSNLRPSASSSFCKKLLCCGHPLLTRLGFELRCPAKTQDRYSIPSPSVTKVFAPCLGAQRVKRFHLWAMSIQLLLPVYRHPRGDYFLTSG